MQPVNWARENRLVEENLPLVGYAVSEMHVRYPMVEREEMVAAGMEGLVLAARSWDPEAGTAFSSWAHSKIRWTIQEMLQGLDWMGRRGRDRAKALNRAQAELTQSLGREPADAELATVLGVEATAVARLRGEAGKSQVPLDDSLSEMLAASEEGPEDQLLLTERDALLHAAVEQLPERMRQIVRLHYFEGMAQGDVARQLGVSDATVSKDKKRGLALLQQALAAGEKNFARR